MTSSPDNEIARALSEAVPGTTGTPEVPMTETVQAEVMPWEEPAPETQFVSFADGLRALADLVDAHGEQFPTMDQYHTFSLLVPVTSREDLIALTKAVGGRWEKGTVGEKFALSQKTNYRGGSDITVYVYTARDNVCERVQTGTVTVERRDPVLEAEALKDIPVETVEEPVYEWICPPSILAGAGDES